MGGRKALRWTLGRKAAFTAQQQEKGGKGKKGEKWTERMIPGKTAPIAKRKGRGCGSLRREEGTIWGGERGKKSGVS